MMSHLKWNHWNNYGIWWQSEPSDTGWLSVISWPPQQSSSDLGSVLLYWGCHKAKHHQTGWCRTEIYHLTVLKFTSLRSRCQQGHAPSGGTREEVFQAPRLVSGGSLASGSTWHCPYVCVRVQIFSFYVDTCHRLQPTLLQLELI